MRRWDLAIALDHRGGPAIFLQVAAAISERIRAGALKPGEPLPGTRHLAGQLGLNRNTVVAAYGELQAEGLVETRVGGGTFVVEPLAETATRALVGQPTYPLASMRHPAVTARMLAPGMLTMISFPDARLFPARALAHAFRRALERRGRTMTRADPRGHERLRTGLASMLSSTRGLPVTAENVLVVRSIQQAIDLAARTLLAPGEVVAVEAFGFPPAWTALKMAGARLVPLPLDEEGLDVGALEKLLVAQPIRAVFLTPHHQFPTGAMLSPRRRERLARLAAERRFVIFEDDYDHEFHYQGAPLLPLASGRAGANVVYLGSLANLLAPGLNTSFIVAPQPVFDRIVALRAATDAPGDSAIESALAELFEDGELLRHMRRVRHAYAQRRDALSEALERRLSGAVRFRLPEGGLAIWAEVDPSIDLHAWLAAGEENGVEMSAGGVYHFLQRDPPCIRLGFTFHQPAELREAVARMERALAAIRPRQVARRR